MLGGVGRGRGGGSLGGLRAAGLVELWSRYHHGAQLGARAGAETEIHRERGSIAPRKVFSSPENFCTEHTFVYCIRNLFGKSLKFLESFWIVWKVSRLS